MTPRRHGARRTLPNLLGPALAMLLTVLLTGGAAARTLSRSTSPRSQIDALDDLDVTTAVLDELDRDPGAKSWQIDVNTRNGIVSLSGTVDTLLQKRRAERITEAVRGVRSVIDQIDVAPTDRSDKEIGADVRQALALDPATTGKDVKVMTEDGMVTLEGAVKSFRERQLAGTIAASVLGVRGVENAIDVHDTTRRSDDQIRTDISDTLHWDALVDDALVQLGVHEGKVTLKGEVGSAAEKDRVETDAWVAGVHSVDTSGLEVAGWTRSDQRRGAKYEKHPDGAVANAVRAALRQDPRVSSARVMVDARHGTITLSGIVSNLKARRAAAHTARDTVGVWRVRNFLTVHPEMVPTGTALTRRIRAALARDAHVSAYDIGVSVKNGIARLTGAVPTTFDRAEADDVVSRVNGVVAIQNDLTVRNPRVVTYDPYVDQRWDINDYDWYDLPAFRPTTSDWAIRQDIESQLLWSPFVDANEVHVSVRNGVAQLTGVVTTWREREAATENAYQGGARLVENDLKVRLGPSFYAP